MRNIVIDLDNTITIDDPSISYEERLPRSDIVRKIIEYKKNGFTIIIYSARNMNSFSGNIGKINAQTIPKIVSWLDRHLIPYDEIYIGKPWCGLDGFYVDDKAVRPNEFLEMNYQQILKIIK